jgi:hypothetical protein
MGTVKLINKTTTQSVYEVPFQNAATKNVLFVRLHRKQIHASCHKTHIFVTLGTFFWCYCHFIKISIYRYM